MDLANMPWNGFPSFFFFCEGYVVAEAHQRKSRLSAKSNNRMHENLQSQMDTRENHKCKIFGF